MFPTRAAVKALGTNPLSLGANGTGGDSYLLDMATSAVAIGKVCSELSLLRIFR